jgi:hypothetical protein
MKTNKKSQAPVVEETQEDVVEEKEPELTEEQKKEKIHNLLLKLQEAKEAKEVGAQKKLRRNLRKLGFYISREKEHMMSALLEANE